jgi:hypothetical protein
VLPGFIALRPECQKGGLAAPHSGPYVGAPVASLRCRILRTGVVTLQLLHRSVNKSLHRAHSGVITTVVLNPLLRWPLLKCSPMAGFQVITEAPNGHTGAFQRGAV